MKAAILTAQHQPLALVELGVPVLRYGQVLVDIHYSGICGSQLGEIDGVKGPDRWLPHCLGHEGSGIVTAIGEDVTKVAPGDHVVLHWKPNEGVQGPPPHYDWQGQRVHAGLVTTFQEQAVVSENRLTQIPNDFDLECAALYGCALTTGFGVITNDARVAIGESVVVVGAGGMGLAEIIGARLAGAYPIVAVDLHETKLTLARQLGATHVCNSSQGPWTEYVTDILGGPADVVIENTGIPALIEHAYLLSGARGRTILVGVPRHDAYVSLHTLPLHFDKHLTGSHGGGTRPAIDIPNYIRLQRSGAFDPLPLITHRYPLDHINEAIAVLRHGQVGRCIVRMQ